MVVLAVQRVHDKIVALLQDSRWLQLRVGVLAFLHFIRQETQQEGNFFSDKRSFGTVQIVL
jgi:hypothetical protein